MTSKNTGLVYKISDKNFIQIIKSSSSCAEAMRTLGFKCTTGNANITVRRRISELNINIDHWNDNTKNAHIKNKIPNDKYFVNNQPRNGVHTRERLIQEHLLPYKCAICGNDGNWNGKNLSLQVDHINGDHNDNRLKNIRFLCPNCHSQTNTFAGKNVQH